MTARSFARQRGPLADRLADAALGMLAAVHVLAALAVLIVLFSLSPARAQTAAECGGDNLLVRMEKDDPTAFATVRAEADAVRNGKGIFWKIEKDGVEPSWLLGTMHVTDPRVVAMPEPARAAFAAAGTVIIESDEIADEKKAGAAILARPDLTMFAAGGRITDLIDARETEVLSEGLRKRGIPLSAVVRMKPWMIMSFVALPACETARKAKGIAFLDQRLARDALAEGKTLQGLETLVEQISALDSLPMEPQVQGLIQTLKLGDALQDVTETMIQLYLAGETGTIMPMMRAATPETADGAEATGDDAEAYADFEQRIIVDRNHLMAERAAPMLARGNAFMAVGALHLPGEEGVVELLRRQGFTLSRVE
ncbi:TraB/GumN family protein [Shinella daejeonensis]|uniref:TraB/GumN family protein n=1 Tax=Shinella daejeonensis TaxID=659017 RepID=UPI0020C7D507|nr:TraB/GumN family protein [Shinella daejeonensis]MCP8895971.1 TraB/GumN family protein [Shinella daejeonensis]